ncbi:MAG: prepilin-type N-terminal cleavage/methylation domain-containing protein [Phycisphaerales bacterium]|jgi:general secretion pathway protein G|nr:prepilin-type N-terminal cleavage/methylation domain-containing protein [Phycisphaerales bacterium]
MRQGDFQCVPVRVAHGFTLVELLVTVGIIGLLIGILLPVLGRARQASRASACLSQTRQVITAVATFTTDNKGKLPVNRTLTSATEHVTWRHRFMTEGYLNNAKAWCCPAHPQVSSEPGPLSELGRVDRTTTCVGDTPSSYALNGHILWRESTISVVADRADVAIARPSHTALVVESTAWWPDMRVIDALVATDNNGTGFYGYWHFGQGSYAFLDGHAEQLKFLATGSPDCRWHNGRDLSIDPNGGQITRELGQHDHPDWSLLVPEVYRK